MKIKKLLLAISLFLIPNLSFGAIEYVTSTQANADVASSLSFSFNAPAGGSNRMLILVNSNTRSRGTNTPTYNGVSMTSAYSYSNGFSERVNFWYLANPATGSNTLSFSSGGSNGLGACAYLFTGVDQSNPIHATSSFGSSGTTNASLTITTTADNKYIVDGMTNTDSPAVASVTATSTQTLRCDLGTGHGDGSGGEYSFRSSTRVATTTGAYVMNYNWGAADNEQVAYAAIALNEAAASSNRKIRGVGVSR